MYMLPNSNDTKFQRLSRAMMILEFQLCGKRRIRGGALDDSVLSIEKGVYAVMDAIHNEFSIDNQCCFHGLCWAFQHLEKLHQKLSKLWERIRRYLSYHQCSWSFDFQTWVTYHSASHLQRLYWSVTAICCHVRGCNFCPVFRPVHEFDKNDCLNKTRFELVAAVAWQCDFQSPSTYIKSLAKVPSPAAPAETSAAIHCKRFIKKRRILIGFVNPTEKFWCSLVVNFGQWASLRKLSGVSLAMVKSSIEPCSVDDTSEKDG